MSEPAHAALPTMGELRVAVEQFLCHAYADGPPAVVRQRFLPPEEGDPVDWLMSAAAERHPDGAPLAEVRAFCLRIGNSRYPHMKLCISRPPQQDVYVLTVDAHDAMLQARPGSPDAESLEQLKRHNAALAAKITAAWEGSGLLTEHAYLRREIRRARQRAAGS